MSKSPLLSFQEDVKNLLQKLARFRAELNSRLMTPLELYIKLDKLLNDLYRFLEKYGKSKT